MATAAADFSPWRFSTDDLPARDRVPFWREFFIRKVMRAEIEHLSDHPLEAEATFLAWPGLRAGWFNVSTLMTCYRTRTMVGECDDSLSFFIKKSGNWTLSQRQREVSLREGEAVGVLDAEPARKTVSQLTSIRLFVPRTALAPLVGEVDKVAMKVIPHDNEALLLLRKYVSVLPQDAALMTPELRQLAVTHIHDLIAMALGATRDGAAIAHARGLRAARLQAVKSNILENIGNRELSVNAVALRQRVTPRYIHMLFELEGVTFSEFVLEERLARAHRMLSNPRFADLRIATIAFAVGFGDLSYFNRTFRRRFGATPSQLRNA
jgi:AraC-like DNA-binding protein